MLSLYSRDIFLPNCRLKYSLLYQVLSRFSSSIADCNSIAMILLAMPSIQDLLNFLYYNLVLILSDLHIKPIFTINCSLRFNFGSDFVGNRNFSSWSFLKSNSMLATSFTIISCSCLERYV